MPIFEKWYQRKKPTLQIRILKIIALEGESSKRKLQDSVNAHYPDISDAVESLKKGRIIKQSRADFGKGRRAEIYYKLTDRGLEAIIDEFPDTETFWKSMISYCSLSEKPVRPEEFDKYYKAFEDKYIGYSQIHDFFSHFDFFDELFANELKNRRGVITIFQKVMECIALHRSITLDQITEYLTKQRTKRENAVLESIKKLRRNPNAQFPGFTTPAEEKRFLENDVTEVNIKNVLDRHSLSPSYGLQELSEISDSTEVHNCYLDFISHLLIHVVEDETGKKYELSLFGVVLTLAMIYYDQHNPSKIFFAEFLNQPRTKNYYNIVVSSYKEKIPLIFFKWPQLIECFYGVEYLMANFESVFYKEVRDQLISLPMNMGGVKELYDNVQAIAYNRYLKLTEIYQTGMSVLETGDNISGDHMLPIEEKLSTIHQHLAAADLKKFMINAPEQNCADIHITNLLSSIEKSFAYELSFIFYIALTRRANFLPTFTDEHIFPSRFVEFMRGNEERRFVTPRLILSSILEDDKEMKDYEVTKYDEETREKLKEIREIIKEMKDVRDSFSFWMKSAISYEDEVIKDMVSLQNEIGLN